MTPQERKTQAIELRAAGQTYQQIADTTGYSVDWCKKNLKAVEKNQHEKQAIKQAVSLAQSKDGITVSQIRNLVRLTYPPEEGKEYEQLEEKAIRRFKSAIKKEPNTIIRPYWMQPENARISLNLLLSSVDSVMISLSDAVNHVRHQLDLDHTYDISLRYAIIKLLFGSGLTPEGVENHCTRLNELVLTLEERNATCQSETGRTFVHPLNTYPKKCALSNPSVEKCISADLHEYDYQEICLDELMKAFDEAY